MRDKAWYPIVFMFAVTAFFSAILIGFGRVTRERVESNRKIAFERAVLLALPLDLSSKDLYSPSRVHRIFTERVKAPDKVSGGAYLFEKDGKTAGYALPIEGKGFWDEIRGVVGIAPDRETVTGVAFYDQRETPGLGAEIAGEPFRGQFKGKRLAAGGEPIFFKRPGERLGPSDVHAVTGATQTSGRLEKFMNEDLVRWRNAMEEPR